MPYDDQNADINESEVFCILAFFQCLVWLVGTGAPSNVNSLPVDWQLYRLVCSVRHAAENLKVVDKSHTHESAHLAPDIFFFFFAPPDLQVKGRENLQTVNVP